MEFDFPYKQGTSIAKLIPHASPDCIDLIQKLLIYNPDQRPSAKQVLRHPFFRELREAEKASAIAGSSGHPNHLAMMNIPSFSNRNTLYTQDSANQGPTLNTNNDNSIHGGNSGNLGNNSITSNNHGHGNNAYNNNNNGSIYNFVNTNSIQQPNNANNNLNTSNNNLVLATQVVGVSKK